MSAVVTQADREAAAALIEARPLVDNTDIIKHAGADDSGFVQAFARHRSEAVEELVAALDDGAILVRSLMLELGICDHIVRIDGRAVSTAAFLDRATAATLSKHRAPIAQGGS
jgi:hypothetical protein